jgi:hypothetical protein
MGESEGSRPDDSPLIQPPPTIAAIVSRSDSPSHFFFGSPLLSRPLSREASPGKAPPYESPFCPESDTAHAVHSPPLSPCLATLHCDAYPWLGVPLCLGFAVYLCATLCMVVVLLDPYMGCETGCVSGGIITNLVNIMCL